MARTPSPRYYESRKAYYVQYRGRQHLLAAGPKDEPDGPTYWKAIEKFQEVLHAEAKFTSEDNCTVSIIITRYKHSLKLAGKERTLELTRRLLKSAVQRFGMVKTKELKIFAVTDWLAGQTWSETTRRIALDRLLRAFSWAAKSGMIAKNPIAGIEKPEGRKRGVDAVLPEELCDLLQGAANREFAKVFRALRRTGARPGEIVNAECRHYRPDLGAIIFSGNPAPGDYRWKNAKRTGKARVIYLDEDIKSLVEEEIKKRKGKGVIFRTLRGKRWTVHNLTLRFYAMRRRKNVRAWCRKNGASLAAIMPYGLRHTYCTRMLLKGTPVKLLADLMGTSVGMIESTYGHASDDLEGMRRLFLRFSENPAPSPPDKSV